MDRNLSAFRLSAISPLDGRYRSKLEELSALVSESALIRQRLIVELTWLRHLLKQPEIRQSLRGNVDSDHDWQKVSHFMENIPSDAEYRIKAFEKQTNHDVKAVEYYLREQLTQAGVSSDSIALIHFACTSEDINNLAYARILRSVRELLVEVAMKPLLKTLLSFAEQWAEVPMLSRTHGQSASPTTVGKEFIVFYHRLRKVFDALSSSPIEGKMNGAVGNYNAHYMAFPDINWPQLSRDYIEGQLSLTFNPVTTQIENHDSMVLMVDHVRRFNTVLIGFCRDMWSYISIDYFKLASKSGEVGSSTMPHKVNPIDFENSEGNLGMANAIAQHFSEKLPVSRWQRDLSDSTVQRSLGSFFAYSLVAYKSLLNGLAKVSPNRDVIAHDLNSAWEVLAEAVQTVMRRYGYVDAYERLKALTRGRPVDQLAVADFIRDAERLPQSVKEQLLRLSPSDYTGIAGQLARSYCKESSL